MTFSTYTFILDLIKPYAESKQRLEMIGNIHTVLVLESNLLRYPFCSALLSDSFFNSYWSKDYRLPMYTIASPNTVKLISGAIGYAVKIQRSMRNT